MTQSAMWIAVDAMGGDRAPGTVVAGACRAAVEDAARILLVGRLDRIEPELERLGVRLPLSGAGAIELVHAEEVVGMDEPAVTPLRRKPGSSIRRCADLVREGRARSLVTAGNTGAALIAAKVVIGTVPGVERPALAAVLPNAVARTVLLDVGANVDTRPSLLREFAIMGHSYAREILGIERPRVGLLSIGQEECKSSDLTREVFKSLQVAGLELVGNVEGSDVFSGRADVVVCDGFVGNAVLKSAEALADLATRMLAKELRASWRTRLGYALARPAVERFRMNTDYAEYGAAPLLGLDGGCFIAHGHSNPRAIQSAVRRAVEFAQADVHWKIRDRLAELHSQEER
ncbi:MAG TPA: phosphate acyltransferase PlsX, partial [Thermoanaerobaculia bacterium]|nr:phosphate acyltransferase PlsX [Thermoanaerobaculia bacterium]